MSGANDGELSESVRRQALPGMDLHALRELLDRENVDPKTYSLDSPIFADEIYVLERVSTSFAVFYSERGLRTGERDFSTLDGACRQLLDLLVRDRTTRRDWAGSV